MVEYASKSFKIMSYDTLFPSNDLSKPPFIHLRLGENTHQVSRLGSFRRGAPISSIIVFSSLALFLDNGFSRGFSFTNGG
mmetsp:Transcript_5100/g.10767  ORF Transcript_5100/g.10767 Transcript_5100/m.10767 type:complete len:80 (-) Transcript_5100:263-502(-)